MHQGFARDKRLLHAAQFKAVFDAPDSRAGGNNILLLARRNAQPLPRLGMVIGKKSVKLAVQRNRVKRLVREGFRAHQQVLGGLDIVVLARKGLDAQENGELSRHLQSLWKRLLKKLPGEASCASSPCC